MASPSLQLRQTNRALRSTNWLRASQRCTQFGPVREYSTEKERKTLRDQLPETGLRPFQTQLWDSTYQRIQRERKERAKYSAFQKFADNSANRTVAFIAATATALYVGYYIGGLRAPPPAPITSTTPLDEVRPLDHDTRPFTLQAAWAQFVELIGEEHVITAPGELESHGGSSWSTHPALPNEIPFVVLKPETTEQVSEIMKICHARHIPTTSFSGGTSLEGHFTSTRGGVCIDFSRMGKILQLHADDLDVVVQPGVGWEGLNEELAKSGLFFPPDPGPGAQIGGMIGTGCSGTNSYRYGTMKDWVLSLTVVLADGTIVKTRQRPRKSSAGYDLTRLFIGSEGTLGLVTEATLKLIPRAEQESVAVASFPTVKAAAEAAVGVIKAGIPVAAVEIMDDVQMKCINDAGMTTKVWKEIPTLLFKFASTKTAVKEHISLTKAIANSCGSKSFEFARTKEEATELWSARKESLWSVIAQSSEEGHRVWTTDVAVPISKLAQIIEETQADIKASGLLGTILGHVGDGNFHSIILYNSSSAKEQKLVEDIVRKMVYRAIEMEGTATGEHGVGLVKRKYLDKELGPNTVDLMRRVKLAFDPLCLLNPDKVVAVEHSADMLTQALSNLKRG
ncbi:D-lactate dehydrogenase [Microthyrium microscopicum]|uniref:D-lactate dehydrogenase (cytochrome) n=1 Tax=Microthyrium microscopicum TaxID=703497 RepID=A0A6A6UAI9_9PEZI|nr:D-lactate dehydrogenase [Microthyrium microscopicum]